MSERPRGREISAGSREWPHIEDEKGEGDTDAATMTDADLIAIATIRKALWANRYRPVPVLSHTDPDLKSAGKAPLGKAWQKAAQKTPPEVVQFDRALRIAANTGVWCGGLRVIDFDLDDGGLANACEELAVQRLGGAPTRRRDNSDHFAMVYRAAAGEPPKRSITGASHGDACACKVEVLGKGQQLVAYGTHVTGGKHYWSGPEPIDMPVDQLPAVTEAQITEFLVEAAVLIGAPPPGQRRAPLSDHAEAPRAHRPQSSVAGDSFVAQVNTAALGNLAIWVKDVFPEAAYQEGTGAYRVAPADRGRPDLQEDISLHPDGIQDFGLEHGLTPIEVVVEFGDAADAEHAALWLCERIGIDPAHLGWLSPSELQAQLDAGPGYHGTPRGNGKALSGPQPQPGAGDGEPPPHPGSAPDDGPPRARRKRRNDQSPPYASADLADLWDPWEDPPPPAWPNTVLAAEAEDTLDLISQRDGIHIGTLAMSVIAAGAAAAPKDARFFAYSRRATGWSVPPIFWLMLIGGSGLRKTILDQIAFAPLRSVQSDLWRPYTHALRKWKRAPAKGRGPKPEEPHSFVVDDVTPEKLGDILAATTRGTAMFKDEIAGLFEFGRYRKGGGEAARSFYLTAYEDGPTTVHRIGRDSANIEHTGLSIFGGIQPTRLADFEGLASDGLMQRFSPLRTPPAVAARPEIDIGTGLDDLHRAIAALCKLQGRNYTTTPEGTALIQETERAAFGYATITDFSEGWPGFCYKLHGTHARLALILHLLETPEAPGIATATVARAHRLVHGFVLQHARDFYAAIPGSNQERLRDIAGWLLTRQDGNTAPDQWERILASDLTSGVKSCRPLTSKGIGDALDPFVTRGWLTPETDYPGNRAWLFDPAIRTALADRQRTERKRRAAIRDEIDRLACHRH